MLIIYSILFIIVFIYLLFNKKYQNFLVQPNLSVVKENIPTFATQLTNLEGEQDPDTPDKTGFNGRINAIYNNILNFIIGLDN